MIPFHYGPYDLYSHYMYINKLRPPLDSDPFQVSDSNYLSGLGVAGRAEVTRPDKQITCKYTSLDQINKSHTNTLLLASLS